MSIRFFLPVLPAILALILFSCKKEDRAEMIVEPAIAIREVGANNSKEAYAGTDLHIDAGVNAPGRIASIKVQITLATTNYGWDFRKTYIESYAGLKQAGFHEHINIPQDARAGVYHLLIIVTDESGRKTEGKVNFEIKVDPTLPLINAASVKLINSGALTLYGNIQAPGKIAKLDVEIQSSAWTKLYSYTDSNMVGQVSYILNKSIDISSAPSGHYHINIRLFDQDGKTMFYQFHLDK